MSDNNKTEETTVVADPTATEKSISKYMNEQCGVRIEERSHTYR